MITGLNHVSIAVPDLDAAIKHLEATFGLTAGEVKVNERERVRVVWFDLGNAKIELTQPLGADSPLAKFLERNPVGGLHHFCLDVDNAAQSANDLKSAGVRVLGTPSPNVNGDPIVFLHPKDFLGALVELEQHPKEQVP
ncbi:MAG: methylmalonyl-CoA epimerase [Burkholderiales bacterium]